MELGGSFDLKTPRSRQEIMFMGTFVRFQCLFCLASGYHNQWTAFQKYSVIKDPGSAKLVVLENREGLPWSVYIGVVGMPGKLLYASQCLLLFLLHHRAIILIFY
jgi:hypothetical protein